MFALAISADSQDSRRPESLPAEVLASRVAPRSHRNAAIGGAASQGRVRRRRVIENRRWISGHRAGCLAASRRAASMVAMSIFFIGIIAAKARLASAPPAASASVSARGVICQERPQRSLHQPHALSWPPLPTIAFQ
jgi:hypothetical protein